MKHHVAEPELALYSTGDLSLWRRAAVRLHVARCESCRSGVEAYRSNRRALRRDADKMPDGLNWEMLAAEMTANIHLGLAAGECVTPHKTQAGKRGRLQSFVSSLTMPALGAWKPAAIAAGVTVLLVGAFWLNMPSSDMQSLGRAFRRIADSGFSRPQRARLIDDRTPFVEISPAGIALHEKGAAIGLQSGATPVGVSLSVKGSASARYVDLNTGQVTVTSVYVE
jgi:hypothetical protein